MHRATAAAEDTLSRIARHKDAAAPAAAKLLAVIESRLLDPEFSASDLEPDEPAYKTLQAFRAATGLHPGDYLALARGIVAARLLCDTDLSQEKLARRAGLGDKSALRKLCLRLFERRPGRLRAEAREARRAGREPAPTLDRYRRFLAGELGSEEVSEIAARRERQERQLGLPTASGPLMFKLAPAALDHQLELLCLHPHPRRLELLRRGVYLGSKEVFAALSERSRGEGRLHRGRGVELAEMALAAVEGCVADLGAEKAGHLALAWARLGNARRLAADLEGAETAIGEAEAWVETARRWSDEAGDLPSALQARWLEGQLLRQEGRLEAAEPLLKEARAGFVKIGEVDMTAIVSLELALLYHEQGGRADQVATYAANALPALEALKIPEAHSALALLREAIRESRFHSSVLELARRRLLAPGAS